MSDSSSGGTNVKNRNWPRVYTDATGDQAKIITKIAFDNLKVGNTTTAFQWVSRVA
jgi:hypothetical protein